MRHALPAGNLQAAAALARGRLLLLHPSLGGTFCRIQPQKRSIIRENFWRLARRRYNQSVCTNKATKGGEWNKILMYSNPWINHQIRRYHSLNKEADYGKMC